VWASLRREWWYRKYMFVNKYKGYQRRYGKYGRTAFLPHRHIPSRIPAGGGWYCVRCGTRNATVQRRGQSA